jgi:hypothetical protein
VAAQRGHTVYQSNRIRQRLATGAWRDFHENKTARLPYVDPSTEYACTLRHLQASDARWRAEKPRAQSYTLLGRREWEIIPSQVSPSWYLPCSVLWHVGWSWRRGRATSSPAVSTRRRRSAFDVSPTAIPASLETRVRTPLNELHAAAQVCSAETLFGRSATKSFTSPALVVRVASRPHR